MGVLFSELRGPKLRERSVLDRLSLKIKGVLSKDGPFVFTENGLFLPARREETVRSHGERFLLFH